MKITSVLLFFLGLMALDGQTLSYGKDKEWWKNFMHPDNSGDRISNVRLWDYDFKKHKIRSVISENKYTVVTFFAEWCGPCRKEMDELGQRYSKWKSDYSTEVIAISIDDKREDFQQIPQRAYDSNWKYKIFWDKRHQSMGEFQIKSIPYTMILDSKGYIIHRHEGYQNGASVNEIEEKLKSLK